MIELLAPAGNYECIVAAVQNGANAVYFSGEEYGARSYADNFDRAGLEKAVDYCRLRGVKSNITVNTLCTDRELKKCAEYVEFLAKIGVDAVIVQDLGVFNMIKQVCPSLPIHASTQMTVHNLDGALVLQNMGASRVVLSRELSLENIKNISENSDTELEVFAYGALCMCYSGQCLMSSVFGGRSGNRGKCAQPCRLKYRVNGGEENNFLSLKDLSLAHHIRALVEAGVTSLKIEGRMKGSSYVAAVTRVFRKCIDSGKPPSERDSELLKQVFYRDEFTEGYFTGRTGREMFTLSRAENPYKQLGADVESTIKNTFKNTENIKNKIDCRVEIVEGKNPKILLKCRGFSVQYISDAVVQTAKSKPLDAAAVSEQIKKTGGVPFEFDKVEVELSEKAFLPVSVINELRRGGIQLLEEKIKGSHRMQAVSFAPMYENKATAELKFTCSVFNSEQLKTVLNFADRFSRIYVPAHVISESIEYLKAYFEKIVVSLPAISRGGGFKKDLERIFSAGFDKVQANNISHIKYSDKKMYGGFRMNVFNSEAVKVCKDAGFSGICLSPELNLAQIKAISKCIECEVIGYGRLPLMITENCPAQAAKSCLGCNGLNILTDRKGAELPVMRVGKSCASDEERAYVILNSAPIYTADKIGELAAAGVSCVNLYFTLESPSECADICRMYFENKKPENMNYTRGHFNKGVF